jgi:hypothetical protein
MENEVSNQLPIDEFFDKAIKAAAKNKARFTKQGKKIIKAAKKTIKQKAKESAAYFKSPSYQGNLSDKGFKKFLKKKKAKILKKANKDALKASPEVFASAAAPYHIGTGLAVGGATGIGGTAAYHHFNKKNQDYSPTDYSGYAESINSNYGKIMSRIQEKWLPAASTLAGVGIAGTGLGAGLGAIGQKGKEKKYRAKLRKLQAMHGITPAFSEEINESYNSILEAAGGFKNFLGKTFKKAKKSFRMWRKGAPARKAARDAARAAAGKSSFVKGLEKGMGKGAGKSGMKIGRDIGSMPGGLWAAPGAVTKGVGVGVVGVGGTALGSGIGSSLTGSPGDVAKDAYLDQKRAIEHKQRMQMLKNLKKR